MRYKIILSYNGSNFFGSQIQPHLPTIQGEVERALKLQFQIPVKLFLASRTDKGVHAREQVGSFDLPFTIKCQENVVGLNRRLPLTIRVVDIIPSTPTFHPRHDVRLKEYRYFLAWQEVSILKRNFVAVEAPFNYRLFKKTMFLFKGKHNFLAFTTDKSATTFERTITKIKIKKSKSVLIIQIKGRSFLKQMIRILIGSALKVARRQISLAMVKKALVMGCRQPFNYTAPANGLILWQIKY